MAAPATPQSAPERALDQRMDALQKANLVRKRRAQLKRDVKAGRVSIHTLLLDPPDFIQTMKVVDLLLHVPKYGRIKINKILQQCRIAQSKTFDGLNDRQRNELVGLIRSPSSGSSNKPVKPDLQKPLSVGVAPHNLRALARANEVRLARAELTRRVASGEVSVIEVLSDPPREALMMPIAELLISQRRWGTTRTRKFLQDVPTSENRTLGKLTNRQKITLVSMLSGDSNREETRDQNEAWQTERALRALERQLADELNELESLKADLGPSPNAKVEPKKETPCRYISPMRGEGSVKIPPNVIRRPEFEEHEGLPIKTVAA